MTTTSGNAFLDTLLERTPPMASQPRHGQNYNYPRRLYLKPDATVVWLQGDPHNRAYYEDKGYKLLSEQPSRGDAKSEVARYMQDEYPKILQEQREKAAIVNAIRRAEARDAALNIDTDYDIMSLEELRDFLQQVKDEAGKNIRVIVGKHKDDQPDTRERRLLDGVETTATASIEELERRRGRPGPRPQGA